MVDVVVVVVVVVARRNRAWVCFADSTEATLPFRYHQIILGEACPHIWRQYLDYVGSILRNVIVMVASCIVNITCISITGRHARLEY